MCLPCPAAPLDGAKNKKCLSPHRYVPASAQEALLQVFLGERAASDLSVLADRLRAALTLPHRRTTLCALVLSHFRSQSRPLEPSVRGWQAPAAAAIAERLQADLVSRLDVASQALLHSQTGPFSSRPFTSLPACPELSFPSDHLRALFLRRLRLPLPLSARNCRCRRPLDPLGDHRAACARSGALLSRFDDRRIEVACLCGTERSLPWTPPSCLPSRLEPHALGGPAPTYPELRRAWCRSRRPLEHRGCGLFAPACSGEGTQVKLAARARRPSRRRSLLPACRAGRCAASVELAPGSISGWDDTFRCVLLRRLRLPLPLEPRACRFGGALGPLGGHRTACARPPRGPARARRRAGLSRGWRAGSDERFPSRPQPRHAVVRRATARGCCERASRFRRRTGSDACEPSAARWDQPTPRQRRAWRCAAGGNRPQAPEHLPGVPGCGAVPPRGRCPRGWGALELGQAWRS